MKIEGIYKVVAIVLIITMITGWYSGCISPDIKRDFFMGCVAVPRQPLDESSWINAFELLGNNAEFVLHHVQIDWELFENTSDVDINQSEELQFLYFITEMSKLYNLDVFIVIDPLTQNRENLDPNSVGMNFSVSGVRQAFKNIAIHIAQYYSPIYLGLGSEVNTYIHHHPEDKNNFISLYKETYDLVKQESSETKITTTLQFESMAGLHEAEAHFEIIDEFEPKLDIIGITTYPSPYFRTPDEIPDTYYSQLKEYTNKPVIVAESGWPSGGNLAYHGSEKNQRRFLIRFVELTIDIDLELWIWWFLHDWEEYGDFFSTMGLRKSNGIPKTSWFVWKNIF